MGTIGRSGADGNLSRAHGCASGLLIGHSLGGAERSKRIAIADKCPVRRTLEVAARVITRATPVMAGSGEEQYFAEMQAVCETEAPA